MVLTVFMVLQDVGGSKYAGLGRCHIENTMQELLRGLPESRPTFLNHRHSLWLMFSCKCKIYNRFKQRLSIGRVHLSYHRNDVLSPRRRELSLLFLTYIS